MCSSHPRVSQGGQQGWGSLSFVGLPLGSVLPQDITLSPGRIWDSLLSQYLAPSLLLGRQSL